LRFNVIFRIAIKAVNIVDSLIVALNKIYFISQILLPERSVSDITVSVSNLLLNGEYGEALKLVNIVD
jgi:hypothetical protein